MITTARVAEEVQPPGKEPMVNDGIVEKTGNQMTAPETSLAVVTQPISASASASASTKSIELMSSMTNHRYGPSLNDESDDEAEEKKSHDEGDEEGAPIKKLSEVALAAKSRANSSIMRATDDNNADSVDGMNMNMSMSMNGVEDKNKTAVNSKKVEYRESISIEALNDALEFESLLFSIRRTSARSRLLKLISCLKQVAAKLERCDEVKEILEKITPAKTGTATATNTADTTSLSASTPTASLNMNMTPSEIVSTNSRKRSRPNNDNNSPMFTKFQSPGQTNTDSNSDSNKLIKVDLTLTASPALTLSPAPISPSPPTLPICLNPRSHPPLLKNKCEWVQLHSRGSGLHCPDFNVNNICPLGSNCPRNHVYKPTKPNNRPMTKEFASLRKTKSANRTDLIAWYSKSDLERAYDQYRKITLTKESFSDKIKPDELNVAYYTCCFTCPVDEIVYYAQPFPGDTFVNGNKSSQGIWWYMNMKDARETLATLVIRNLQARGIVALSFQPDLTNEEDAQTMKRKASARAAFELARSAFDSSVKLSTTPVIKKNSVLPSTLPDINPWNWAELDYEIRCVQFSQPQGCPFGPQCPHAHVHFPKSVVTDRYPTKGCLPLAYLEHFQFKIQDPFFQTKAEQRQKRHVSSHLFHVKTLIDNRNQIWYTAAWICPRDKTIYYAAGGSTGRANPQGFVLYPSVEEAKLAVSGVVLTSFLAKGLSGTWTQGYK